MPPKLYVTNYPAGDFRAMPALGAGHALLKWVTSFPGNPARGLPTVSGLVLLSNADDGRLEAVLDAGAVTALRTGAAAVLAAETLGRPDAATAAVVGAGVNGRAAARTFLARGREVSLWDVDAERARAAAEELGCSVAGSLDEALAADLLVTVTPGHELLLAEGALPPGAAREPDGRGRAGQGRDRGVGARADADLLRRLGAGQPQRRARPRGRRRARDAQRRDAARRGAGRRGAGTRRARRRSRASTRPGSRSRISRSRSSRSLAPRRWTCRRSSSDASRRRAPGSTRWRPGRGAAVVCVR